MKKIKLIISSIVFTLLCIFGSFNNIFATFEINDVELDDLTIRYTNVDEKYITYDSRQQKFYKYYYKDKSGYRWPAYCLKLGLEGADIEEYNVNANKELDDKVLASIIFNGYPYQDCIDYDLYTENEKQFATQFAVWAYTENLDLSLIKPLKSDYQRIVDAIKKIYQNGMNGIIPSNNITFNSIDEEFKIDDIDSRYYSKRLVPQLDVKMIAEYKLLNSNYNIKMTDQYNRDLGKYSNEKIIKILVPRDEVTEDAKLTFDILAKVRQNIVLFGNANNAKKQNVAIGLNPDIQNTFQFDLNIKYTPTNLKIIKKDKDNNEIVIPNTKFKILDKTKEKVLGEYTTDENGEIFIDLKKEFKIFDDDEIVLQEIESNKEYYLDKENNEYIVKINKDQDNVFSIENEKIKGKIKILKTSKKYNKLSKLNKGSPLEGTQFNIFDEKGDLIDTVTTNKEGIAITKELLKGKYYIKEIKSSKYYVLSSDIYEVEIKDHNKEVEVNITNDNVEYIEELPNTGM